MLDPWYARTDNLIKQYSISKPRIYNIDETSFQEGKSTDHNSSKVISKAKGNHTIIAIDRSTAWATVVALICTDSKALTPTVILSGDNL